MQVGDDYDICKIANLQWRPHLSIGEKKFSAVL